MYGYIIDFESLPETVWATETNITDYSWKNRHTEGMLEIAITKAKELTLVIGGMQMSLKNTHHISCTVFSDLKEAYSKPETEVEIISVAVKFPKLNIKKIDLNRENCVGDFLFMPSVLADLSFEALSEINILLHKYIKLHTENGAENRLECIAVFFEIIAKISDISKKQIYKHADDIKTYYIKKINYITERDFGEKLTAEMVAKELGISSVYLSSLYKEVTGVTYSRYLLSVRMQKAVDLLLNPNISTARVAALTGYSDENYFRKRFKKFFGMTVKEYRLIKKGLTLYHAKPERKVYEKDE